MKERIAHICSQLTRTKIFADIGCDHGYCTEYMLRKNLCEKAYISDISAKSLSKAETLLAKYVQAGKCIPVVANGLEGIPESCDLVLIAGLGGEEMVEILKQKPLPVRFLLQPMKNSDKVRSFLLNKGARIEKDYTFSEGKVNRKYYDLISGTAEGGDTYSEREIKYGRDNLNGISPTPFLYMMQEERDKIKERLTRSGMRAEGREKLEKLLFETETIIHEVTRDL